MAITYATRLVVGSSAASQSQTSSAGVTAGTKASGVASQAAASSSTARSYAADAGIAAAIPTLSDAAIAALSTPGSIRPIVSVALEVESNRLRRTTTVRPTRGDTLATVALLDPVNMTTASLIDGRRNPTALWAIADVSAADSGVRAFDTAAAGIDETFPAAFARSILGVATVANATADPAGAGWNQNNTSGTIGATSSASALDVDGGGRVWTSSNGAAAYPAGSWIGPAAASSCSYYHPAGVTRDFTAAAYVQAPQQLVACFELILTKLGGGTVTVDGPAFTLPTSATMTRLASSLVAPDPGVDVTYTSMQWRLKILAGNLAKVVTIDAAQAYAGPDRGGLVGLSVATPSPQAVVELTWTDPRKVNRVEATGERRAGQITSARVDVTTDGATWTRAGVAWGSARLAVLLDRAYLALGVRYYVEETTSGDAAPVWVTEVDPMLVLDVSADVAALSATWAREADPGQATSPLGNFQAGSLELELDNTSGAYTPAANASLDRGHRVECALGVRYRNLLGNPRVDVDLTGWTGSPAVERVYPASQGSPTPASARATSIASVASSTVVARVAAGAVAVTAGTTYKFAGWVHAEPTAGAVDPQAAVEIVYLDSTGATVGSTSIAGAVGTAGWQLLTGSLAAPVGAVTAAVRATAQGSTTGNAYRIEATSLRLCALDVTGAEVEYAELVPAGVYYSDPWDAPTNADTVTITALDRLGRRASTPLTEDIQQNVDVGTLLRSLALRYLDLDSDQVSVATTPGAYVIPFAVPGESSDVATYLADIAKATLGGALYIDPLERLVLQDTALSPTSAAAQIRADNALIDQARPVSVDQTASVVVVTAEPLTTDVVTDVYDLPPGGITIPSGVTYQLVCDYTTSPAILPTVTGVVADGAYTILSVVPRGTSSAVVSIRNDAGRILAVAALTVNATPLIAASLSSRVVDQPSYNRYGPLELDVDARLIQTQAQLDNVAQLLLAAFRGLDSSGVRKLGDVALNALGLIHVDVGDLVQAVDPTSGVGASYIIINRVLTYAQSGSMLMAAVARQAGASGTTDPLAVADVSLSDDVGVAGY